MSSHGVRLLGGRFRGRRLRVPRGVRPSSGRLREALLARWTPSLAGARLADLFAGSGAVGLEALGRGAAEVTLFEGDPLVARVLRANATSLATSGWTIVRRSIEPLSGQPPLADRPWDLVFADPPYSFAGWSDLLELLAPLVARHGELAIEHPRRVVPPTELGALEQVDQRRYGEGVLSFYRPVSGRAGRSEGGSTVREPGEEAGGPDAQE